jgi:hypothetical protein
MSDPRMAGRISVEGTASDEQYFKGWPMKCPYNEDLDWGASIGIKYLKMLAPTFKQGGRNFGKTGIVVLDIDDTLVFGDPAGVIGVKEMELGTHNGQDVFILQPNNQIVQLANVSRQLGFKIIALTARPMESKMASITNLKLFKIPHDMLVMNDKDDDPHFKIKIRRSLEKPNQTVVLTVGDQITDCLLCGTSAAIKLPDPERKCCYAYIP